MAELRLERVGKRFGDVTARRRPVARHRRRRVLRAAGAERRRQDDDAAPGRRPRDARCAAASASAAHDVTTTAPALRDVRLRVPAVLAVSAPERVRQPRVSAALAAAPHAREARGARAASSEVARLLHIEDKLRATRRRACRAAQMQRVAIGRALVREPRVYLMDEPLSSLDAKLRNELRVELKRIQQDLGATMLYVTHDQIEATDAGDAHRRARARPPRAGRHAARDLRGPADAARRGAPRLAAHQPRAARRARRLAGARRARRRSASAPSTCTCTTRAPTARRQRCARTRAPDRDPRATSAWCTSRSPTAPPSWSARHRRAARSSRAAMSSSSSTAPLWFDAAGRRIAG